MAPSVVRARAGSPSASASSAAAQAVEPLAHRARGPAGRRDRCQDGRRAGAIACRDQRRGEVAARAVDPMARAALARERQPRLEPRDRADRVEQVEPERAERAVGGGAPLAVLDFLGQRQRGLSELERAPVLAGRGDRAGEERQRLGLAGRQPTARASWSASSPARSAASHGRVAAIVAVW